MSLSRPLLSVDRLVTRFRVVGKSWRRRETVHAVEDVSFSVGPGEIVGLVGESGSGKTTLGRTLLRLEQPTSGSILFEGEDVAAYGAGQLRRYRRQVQAIFQDPASSLNPRMRVRDLVAEPLQIHRATSKSERDAQVRELLQEVGLHSEILLRYPKEFSGGQRQRIGIARALALRPKLIIADEPVSALDVSVQAQIINLLQSLRHRLGVSLLFISHDLPTVEFLCDRVIVLYLGRIMEISPAVDFHREPLHPYSRMLIDSAPSLSNTRRRTAPSTPVEMPSPMHPPSGCVFRTRCPQAIAECGITVPALRHVSSRRAVACIRLNVS